MENTGLISIIIPLYNKMQTIEKCVLSALNQTYHNIEVLIIDDGSTDNSYNAIKYIKDTRLKYLKKKNGGVSSARNYGITKAQGEWLVFLDADDILLPNCVEILYEVTQKYKVMFATGNFYIENKGKRTAFCASKYKGIVKCNFLSNYLMVFVHRMGSCIYHKSIFYESRFNEKLSRYEDAEHMVYVFKHYKIAYIPIPVMIYTLDYSDLSKRKADITKDFIAYIDFNHSTFGERLFYYNILKNAWKHYPHEKIFLDNKYGQIKWKIFISKCFSVFLMKLNRLAAQLFYDNYPTK